MHHPKGFPSRLVRLRADAGMTQKDLSLASGISVPQIGRYEMGTSAPRMTALVKLANALRVDVSELTDANHEPEAVELAIYTGEDAPPKPFTLPADMFEEMSAEAEKAGVPFDVYLSALITFGLKKQLGQPVTMEQSLREAETALEGIKLPDNEHLD